MKRGGKLITFEGPDGAGKTTQVGMAARALESLGYRVLVAREPGGTRLSEAIRQILLDPAFREMNPVAEAFLYTGARAQLVGELILPALAEGYVVLCDRFVDSSIAYQGYGRGLSLEMLRVINACALKGLGSFLTILIDIEPGEGLERNVKEKDRLEQENLSFHRRVRDGYLALAASAPDRIRVVDGSGDRAAVHARVLSLIRDFLEGKAGGAPFDVCSELVSRESFL